jgi:pilus assembly protein CpaF
MMMEVIIITLQFKHILSVVVHMTSNQLIETLMLKLEGCFFVDDEIVNQKIYETLLDTNTFGKLTLAVKDKLATEAFNAIRRFDLLQPFLEDQAISEIMVNGTEAIFVERSGVLIKTEQAFETEERLLSVIHRIVSTVNRTVNTSSPIVDARLLDGSRVNVVLPPIAVDGPVLTIRKFTLDTLGFEEFCTADYITQEALDYLRQMVEAKNNIFISGGTGTGKTTFLNILSQLIHKSDRVITIEDSCELNLAHVQNWVRLETRNPNNEGQGQITIRQLIRTALRMRPDRIIVGEVRGPEALDMLQAMNTGHDGSMSTGHANSIEDALTRLEAMIYSDTQMPMETIRKMILSGLDVIIHLVRMRDGSRRIQEIAVLEECSEAIYTCNSVFNLREVGGENNKISWKLTRTISNLDDRMYT